MHSINLIGFLFYLDETGNANEIALSDVVLVAHPIRTNEAATLAEVVSGERHRLSLARLTRRHAMNQRQQHDSMKRPVSTRHVVPNAVEVVSDCQVNSSNCSNNSRKYFESS